MIIIIFLPVRQSIQKSFQLIKTPQKSPNPLINSHIIYITYLRFDFSVFSKFSEKDFTKKTRNSNCVGLSIIPCIRGSDNVKKVCEDWREVLPAGVYDPHYFEEFSTRATNAAAEVFRVKTVADAKDILSQLIQNINAKKVVMTNNAYTNAANLLEFFHSRNVEAYTDAVNIRTHCETADLGISSVEFGIAETGSVCQDAYAIEDRLVSSLTPIHVAFLNSNYILPSVESAVDVFSHVFKRGYLSLITGPSRTADIERVLTIGVHGPSRLIIIAVDEEITGGEA
jgi:L-lactate dehydrogenase complex protein LldG